MTLLGFIPRDGYTRKAYIKGIPGITPDVRFEFRPVTVPEQSRLDAVAEAVRLDPSNETKAAKADKVRSEILAPKIQSWDLTDAEGKTPEITPANFLSGVHPRHHYRMCAIINGFDAGDEDPLDPANTAAAPSSPETDQKN
jgi:hypothetical protein